MNAKLEERCRCQIENESSLRKLSSMDSEESIKLGSLLYNAMDITADDDKIYECRKILQSKTGFFSNLRGALQTLILLKMTLADDPEAYIDNIIDTYEKLTKDNGLYGLFSVLSAVIIYDQHGDRNVDEVIAQVLQMFSEVKKINPHLSHESDMAYIALMLLSGKADKSIEEEKDQIFKALTERFGMLADAAQSTTLVLITSNKSTDEKIEEFINIYNALSAKGHATSKKRSASIYGAFIDVEAPKDEIVDAICEVDQFLKSQKGYSALSIRADFRRVIASTLTLQYYTIDVPSEQSAGKFNASNEISIESLLFIVLMSIVALV